MLKVARWERFTLFVRALVFHPLLFLLPIVLNFVHKIVEQVLVAKRFLESVGDPAPVTGVVFMGMGEPFDNYER